MSVPVVALLSLAVWLPVLLLSALERGFTREMLLSVIGDHTLTARLLIAVPVLLIAEAPTAQGLGACLRHFSDSGLVDASDDERWRAALARANRWATGGRPMLAIAGIVLGAALLVAWGPVPDDAGLGVGSGWAVARRDTWAWGWNLFIGRPLFLFLAVFWAWRLAVGAVLAVRMSALKLRLCPTHPDRTGGLAFLEELARAPCPLIFSIAAVAAARFSLEVLYEGVRVESLKMPVAVLAAIALVAGLGPLMAFTPVLVRLRREGRLAMGRLSAFHSRSFEARWLGRKDVGDELMGAPEISTLADLAAGHDAACNISPFPFGRKVPIALLLSALLPMVPVLLLEVPLKEIMLRLAKALL